MKMDTLRERLKFAARKKFGAKTTQAKLVEASGVSQSIVGRIWRGGAVTSQYVVELADACGVRGMWLKHGELPMHESNVKFISNAYASSESTVGVLFFDAITFKCGNGMYPHDASSLDRYPVPADVFKQLGIPADRCFVLKVSGDSMAPTLVDSSIVLVHMDDKNWKREKPGVFAFYHEGACRVKRVSERADRSIVVSSDNPDKSLYSDETYSKDMMSGIEIVGRVVWQSGQL